MFDGAQQLLVDHWPLVAFSFLCMVVIQVFKMVVWTERRSTADGKAARFFWWGRKTLSLQALLFGACVGCMPGMPIGGGFSDTVGSRALYYAAAAVLATFMFDILKGLAKKRGVSLSVAGLDLPQADHNSECRCCTEGRTTPIETPVPKQIAPVGKKPC